ncbi:MAG: T9SS type A sorting domain-containing protein, partial [Bacteroidota bacterium]
IETIVSGSGTIAPPGPVSVPHGGSQGFTITADPGNHIDSVVAGGVNQGSVGTYTFTNVTANDTIRAYFSPNVYTIQTIVSGSGTIAPPGPVSVTHGGSQGFTITADLGNHIDSVVAGGVNQGAVGTYTFTNVTANDTIRAYFSPNVYTIQTIVSGSGTIAPPGPVSVTHGGSQGFTITADPLHHIDSVVAGGVNQGPVGTYTFTNVTANDTIRAYFSIDTHIITATAAGGGTITPSGAVAVPHGSDQTFTVAADPGYHIDSVVADGANLGAVAGHTFTSVTGPHTIAAYFSINIYTITAGVSGSGSISPSGAVSVPHGSDQSFSISPDAGHHIDSVVVDGVNAGPSAAWTFPAVSANHSITAYFSVNIYTITATADPGGIITPSGTVYVSHGGSRTFIITPDPGYEIVEVIVDGLLQGDPEMYSFTGVTSNHTIHADFDEIGTFITLPPETLVAKNGLTGKIQRPVRRGRGLHPNWANLISETVVQGGFQPGATESDTAGGMRVGRSFLARASNGRWRPDPHYDGFAWVRLSTWDHRRSVGKGYISIQKTLEDRYGMHEEDPRGLDSSNSPVILQKKPLHGEYKLLPPRKHNNVLFAELVALKFNIAASQLGKTPYGFGELVYENDGHMCDELSLVEISARADSMMTFYHARDEAEFSNLYDALYDINRAFEGPLDTVRFEEGGQLVVEGAVELDDVPFLKKVTSEYRRLVPTTDLTETGEDLEEWEFEEGSPAATRLYQNYPNPFNPSTTIAFRLREPSLVTIRIYDLMGREAAVLLAGEEMEEGLNTVEFLAEGLASGVYFYRVEAAGLEEGRRGVETGKMMLLR